MRAKRPAAQPSKRLRPSQCLYVCIGFVIGFGIHSGLKPAAVVQQGPPVGSLKQHTSVAHHMPGAPAAAAPLPSPSPQAASNDIDVGDITVVTASKPVEMQAADIRSYALNTVGTKGAMKSVLGKKRSKFPDIAFPEVVPDRPPKGKRPMLVAVMVQDADWDKFTLPLLQYMLTMPDAIDVVVLDDSNDETLAHKVVGMGITVLRGPSRPMDQEAAINVAWVYFQHSEEYQFLTVIQADVSVSYSVFDRVMKCFDNVKAPAVLGPMINGMDVGEKTSEMDEQSVSWQNSNHRRNRDYYQGRVPRDTHFRLPYTLKEHMRWFDRALSRFAVSFRKDVPPVPGQEMKVVQWGYNLFKRERLALVDPTVNGREGDRFTAFLTELVDPRVDQHTCLNAYMFKDWTSAGLDQMWGENKWSPPGKRNPKRHKPPKNAEWEKGR